eukprot:2091403-Amphidinium_carterae.1
MAVVTDMFLLHQQYSNVGANPEIQCANSNAAIAKVPRQHNRLVSNAHYEYADYNDDSVY